VISILMTFTSAIIVEDIKSTLGKFEDRHRFLHTTILVYRSTSRLLLLCSHALISHLCLLLSIAHPLSTVLASGDTTKVVRLGMEYSADIL